jgi:hypothetical protein
MTSMKWTVLVLPFMRYAVTRHLVIIQENL